MGLPKNYQKFEPSSEDEFSRQILIELEEHFTIETQVSGRHLTGKRLKIDAVIKPKFLTNWKNPEIAFGIEFKSPSKLDKLGGQMNFMKQCIDYSYCEFGDFGFIPILSSPGFSTDETYSDKKFLTAIRHFLNRFGVGELYRTQKGLSIIFAEHHFIWYDGTVNEGKRWSFKKKFGSK